MAFAGFGREALAAVYDRYADTLYRVAFAQLRTREDAEDAVHDVFSVYIAKQPEFSDAEHEKAWFIRATVNRCGDIRRKRRVGVLEPLDDHAELCAEDETEKAIALEALFQKLDMLPEKIRSVIVLHYLEEMSVEETAKFLGLSRSAVKMRLLRGRALLGKIEEENNV